MLLEERCDAAVTEHVGPNLLAPVIGVGSLPELSREPLPVSAVPEIAVAENRDACRAEYDVWLTGKRREILPITKTVSPQSLAQELFMRGVDTSVHPL